MSSITFCDDVIIDVLMLQVRSHLAAILSYLETILNEDYATSIDEKLFSCERTVKLIGSTIAWIKSTLLVISQ